MNQGRAVTNELKAIGVTSPNSFNIRNICIKDTNSLFYAGLLKNIEANARK
ncbi:TPA: hypothetical protein N2D99_002086 [Clostridium botulinum]|nr:hypothetical protein [Clostridium botulinum]